MLEMFAYTAQPLAKPFSVERLEKDLLFEIQERLQLWKELVIMDAST